MSHMQQQQQYNNNYESNMNNYQSEQQQHFQNQQQSSQTLGVQQSMLPKLLLGGTAIAFLNCFERGDYNVAIYPLMYLLIEGQMDIKEHTKQLIRWSYLILFTLFIDLIWFMYWSGTYSTELDYEELEWMSLPVHLTVFISIIEFFLKIAILYYLCDEFQLVKDALSFENAIALIRQFFGMQDESQTYSSHQQQFPNQQQSQIDHQNDYGYNVKPINQDQQQSHFQQQQQQQQQQQNQYY